MYVAGFGIVLCAVYAAVLGLELSDPLFGATIIGISALGFAVSLFARANPSAGWVVAAIVGSLIGVLALGSASGVVGLTMLPRDPGGDVHRDLGVFLCWLLVLLSFAQLSRGWLLFLCVPGAAILGLVGTVYSEPPLVWLFVLFVFLATFLMVHDQHARMTEQRERKSPQTVPVVGQLLAVAACCLGAVVMGRVLAVPMQAVGAQLVPLGAVAGSETGPDRRRESSRVSVSESSELRIGTGPERDSDTVLMRVRAEHGSYWRGATFDQYTGSGWRSTLNAGISVGPMPSRGFPSAMFDPRMRQSADIIVPRSDLNDVRGPTHTLKQYVRLEGAGRFTDLYGASEPQLYRLMQDPDFGPPLAARADETGRVTLNRPIGSTYYEVESDIAEWTPDLLRRVSDRPPDRIVEMYGRVPNVQGMERLNALAADLTRNASTVYDRVEALRRYLSSTCVYNLEAQALPTDGSDMVSRFVLETREGECKLFGSALAVMCRLVGVPARVASGFLSGEFDAEGQYYVVRERDKHLWTEVYFAGYGWIPFDATVEARDVTPRGEADNGKSGGGLLSAIFRRGVLPPLAFGAALLLVLYVMLSELLRRRRPLTASHASGLSPSARAVLRSYERLSQRLRRRGLSRGPQETPAEYAARLSGALAHDPEALSALDRLTEMVTDARYAGMPMTPGDATGSAELVGVILRAVAARNAKLRLQRTHLGTTT
jgi:hypothetical protein